MAEALAAIRPLVVAANFDAGQTLTAARKVSELETADSDIVSAVDTCAATGPLNADITAFQGRVTAAIDASLTASLNDPSALRNAALSLWKLLPSVLSIHDAAQLVANASGVAFAGVNLPSGSTNTLGPLPPIRTASATAAPAPTSAPGTTGGSTRPPPVTIDDSTDQAGYEMTTVDSIARIVASIPELPPYECMAAIPDLGDFFSIVVYTSTGHTVAATQTSQCQAGQSAQDSYIEVNGDYNNEIAFPAYGKVTVSIGRAAISWTANAVTKKTSYTGRVYGVFVGYSSYNGLAGPFGIVKFSATITSTAGTGGLRAAWASTTRYDMPYGETPVTTSGLSSGYSTFSLTRGYTGP